MTDRELPEVGQGEGEDAVRDGYGVLAGVEDQANLEAVADQVSEPREVLGVGWADRGCEAIWFNGQVQRTTEATAAKCRAAATMVNRCQTSW